MKKKEAEVLALKKVDVLVEYIMQILEDTSKVSGMMNFSSAKIDGQNMCTMDIYVPFRNFEKHLNLGITSDHYNVLCKEFLDRVITTFLPHETIGATRFYQFRSNNIFDGVSIVNSIGSEIKVNMYGVDRSISNEYNSLSSNIITPPFFKYNVSHHKMISIFQ